MGKKKYSFSLVNISHFVNCHLQELSTGYLVLNDIAVSASAKYKLTNIYCQSGRGSHNLDIWLHKYISHVVTYNSCNEIRIYYIKLFYIITSSLINTNDV